MKRLLLASCAALGLVFGLEGGLVRAQFSYVAPQTSPFYRPAISPYLNLALPGNRAINYFGLVQPQIYQANAIQQLQTQSLYQQQLLTGGVNPYGYGGYGAYGPYGAVPITGYGARFQNQWGYFQNWRTGTVPNLLGPNATPSLAGGVGTPGFLTPTLGVVGLGTTPRQGGGTTNPGGRPNPGGMGRP